MTFHKPLDEIFPDPPAALNPADLDPQKVPEHLAVIMDGNGRWAKERGKQRIAGHRAGVNAVRELIRCASDVGVRYLTIYSFSSENWKRPKDEVSGLMSLFARTMSAEIAGLDANDVRVMTIGDTSKLPAATRKAFDDAWEKTKDNTGMTLVVAVNYGGRDEILSAVNELLRQRSVDDLSDKPFEPVDEAQFERHLYTAGIPDPDLVLRTSGEMRISNFLLWQIAYAEFYCSDVLWPDFDRYELLRALLDFQGRARRFGGVK